VSALSDEQLRALEEQLRDILQAVSAEQDVRRERGKKSLSQSMQSLSVAPSANSASAAAAAATAMTATAVTATTAVMVDAQAVQARKEMKRSRSAGLMERDRERDLLPKKLLTTTSAVNGVSAAASQSDWEDEEVCSAFGVVAAGHANSRSHSRVGGAAQPVEKMFAFSVSLSPPRFLSLSLSTASNSNNAADVPPLPFSRPSSRERERDRERDDPAAASTTTNGGVRENKERERVRARRAVVVDRPIGPVMGLDEYFASQRSGAGVVSGDRDDCQRSPFSSSTSAFEDRSVGTGSLASSRSSHTHTSSAQLPSSLRHKQQQQQTAHSSPSGRMDSRRKR
jgi:hypothetical protein